MTDTAEQPGPDVCPQCGFCWSVFPCDEPEEQADARADVRAEVETA